MTDTSSALTASEFLRLRRNIADDRLLKAFDEQLRDICVTEPDEAVQVFDALAHSDITYDRATVALFARHLLAPRRQAVAALLRILVKDLDQDIRQHAADSIAVAVEEGIITATDAARIYDTQPS